MEYRYPAHSNSKLFSGFNPVGPTPVDNPTFYKGEVSRGELFSLADTNSAFHPNVTAPPNGFYKAQKSSGMSQDVPGYPSSSAASSSQMNYERFRELTYFDEDMVESDVDMEFGPGAIDGDGHYPYGTQYHQFPQSDQWPGWEAMNPRLAPIPVSTARSSLECTPPILNNRGLRWEGDHAQPYDLHAGQESPQHRFDRCEIFPGQGNLPYLQPLYPQPQNTPLETPPSTSSLASSSIYRTSLSINNTVSPSASSDTSSTSSSTLSSPELTVRTPFTLHQPRPSRRIPIVSLSELALACDDFAQSPSMQSLPYQELLSPLTLDFPAKYTSVYSPEHPSLLGETRIEGPRFAHQEQKYPHQFHTAPTYYVGDRSEEVVLCSCGCMESYVIPQNNRYPAT